VRVPHLLLCLICLSIHVPSGTVSIFVAIWAPKIRLQPCRLIICCYISSISSPRTSLHSLEGPQDKNIGSSTVRWDNRAWLRVRGCFLVNDVTFRLTLPGLSGWQVMLRAVVCAGLNRLLFLGSNILSSWNPPSGISGGQGALIRVPSWQQLALAVSASRATSTFATVRASSQWPTMFILADRPRLAMAFCTCDMSCRTPRAVTPQA
jgi:hypothetical protein